MLRTLPANLGRGLTALCGIIIAFIAAVFLWGWATAFLILGSFIVVDCSSDEIIKRVTMTKRDVK